MPSQPQNTPVIAKPTPVVLDELLIETTDSNKALYDREFEFGHLYPDQIRYPGFRFLAVKPTQYGQMQYTWGNGFTAQDSYNVTKDYSGDYNACPIFSRSYRVLRSQYLRTGPSTKGTSFTGIVAIAVTAGGSGYTEDFAVTITPTGGGVNAAATAIVSNGAVVRVELTNVGVAYASAPTIGFGAGSGTGASAVASLQPVTAVLVSEKHSKLPDDDPYTSLYDKVTLVYETLPGPWLPITRWDDDLGQVYGKRRAVLADPTSQVEILAQFSKTGYAARDGSAIVSLEIVENYSDGTGTGIGNEVYPLKTEHIYDNDRGDVDRTRQIVVKTGSETASDSLVGTTATKTWYESYGPSKYFLFKIIETFETPCPLLVGREINADCQGEIATIGSQILAISAANYTPDFGALEYRDMQIDAATKKRHLVYAAYGFPALVEVDYDMTRNGRKITRTYMVVDISTSSGGAGVGYKYEFRRIDKYRKLQIYTEWDAPADPYYERRTGAFDFPALLNDGDYDWSDACGAFSHIQTHRSILTQFITKHEFFSSLQSLQSYFVLRPVTHLIGRGWQIAEGTINNEGTFTYTGGCTGTYDFTASSPDLDTYNGLIDGTPQLMAEENVLDEDLRYHRISHYLVMK